MIRSPHHLYSELNPFYYREQINYRVVTVVIMLSCDNLDFYVNKSGGVPYVVL